MRKSPKGKGGFKDLLLAHGEKFVMGVVGLCLIWFIYNGLGRQVLDPEEHPDQLRNLVQRARENMTKYSYEDFPDNLKPVPAAYASDMKSVEVGDYATELQLDPPDFPPRIRRGDPPLLAVQDLEVTAGVGLFAMVGSGADRATTDSERPPEAAPDKPSRQPPARPRASDRRRERPGQRGRDEREEREDEKEPATKPLPSATVTPLQVGGVRVGASDKIEGRCWAVVVGKVPVDEQQQAYRRVFRDAEFYDSESDVPRYRGYFVQRKEIVDGESEWELAKRVNRAVLTETVAKWSSQAEPVEDPRYIDDLLTYPLPPLVQKGWDAVVTHSDMRPASAVDQADERQADGNDEAREGSADDDAESLTFLTEAVDSAETESGVRSRGATKDRGRGAGHDEPVMEKRGAGQRDDARGANQGPVSYKLFRFFDLTVESGHQYQYRVQLVLDDPNDKVNERYLNDGVIKRRQETPKGVRPYRLGDWSEPTPVVTVPSPGSLLAGPVRATRAEVHYAEPTADLVARTLDLDAGVEGITKVEKVRRGSVCNFTQTAHINRFRTGGESDEAADFAFETDRTLLDLRGGRSLPPTSLTEPGELLFLDSMGRLVVRTETGDQGRFRQYEQLLEQVGQDRDGGRGGGPKAGRPEDDGGLFDTDDGRDRRGRSRDDRDQGRDGRDRNTRGRDRPAG